MKRFRRAPLLFLCALLFPVIAHAQLTEEEGEFDLEPDELTYVGLGVGVTPMAVFMDLDELNKLGSELQLDRFEGPLFLWSGMLVLTPVFLNGGRVAFHGAIGYHKQSKQLSLRPEAPQEMYTRTLRFGVRFLAGGGLEYAMPMTRKFTILPGLIIGWGSYALELTQTQTDNVKFRQVINDSLFNTAGTNFNRAARMINTHAWLQPFLKPSISFEYAVTGFVMVRLSGGYHFGSGADWEDEGGTIYEGVPDITANGPYLQLGLFGGLWQQ